MPITISSEDQRRIRIAHTRSTQKTQKGVYAENAESRRLQPEPRRAAAYRDPLTCDECGCFLSKHDTTCSQWQEVTVEANVVTFHRPAAGWPTLAELIAQSIALGGDPFGTPRSDEEEYGPICMFCGCRTAVCRCDS